MYLGGRSKARVSFCPNLALCFDDLQNLILARHISPVRKNNRESLEQLPNLILKLTEEVKELKLSNSEFMENIRYLEGAASMEVRPSTRSTKPAINPLVGRSSASCFRCFYTHVR